MTTMTKQEIEDGISQIEDVLMEGGYLCSNDQPCAAAVYYDEGADTPWRIADDWTSESYRTLADAIAGAREWCEIIARDSQ